MPVQDMPVVDPPAAQVRTHHQMMLRYLEHLRNWKTMTEKQIQILQTGLSNIQLEIAKTEGQIETARQRGEF